jgi:cytochrome c553
LRLFGKRRQAVGCILSHLHLQAVSPSYVVRQLYDIQSGARAGAAVQPMKRVVKNLTIGDMAAIAAYTASLNP